MLGQMELSVSVVLGTRRDCVREMPLRFARVLFS